MEQAMVIHDQ
jgi:hypothetical protein